MTKALIIENIRIAIQSIKANILRSVLTIFIIAFGIMALVGILTSIDAIKNVLTNQFALMGANSFAIVQKNIQVQQQGRKDRKINVPIITYTQAIEFKQRYSFPAIVAISANVSDATTIKYKDQKTDPNISLWGVDENDAYTNGRVIEKGRNFSVDEIKLAKHVAILGKDVVKKIFKTSEDPIGKIISVSNAKYRVIGIFQERGASFGGWDRICLIPITNARQYFSMPNQSYRINIMPYNTTLQQYAISEAECTFRNVRRLKPFEDIDFSIESANSLSEMFINNLRLVTMAATIIGFITLFGAAIGLMNIMLVSVTERTTEIGIRKALGAKPSMIQQQFLIESILIGQLGGLLGILLGILIGNVVSIVMGGKFLIPWLWILLAVFLCMVVSVSSGFYPAKRASSVVPIISLHYE